LADASEHAAVPDSGLEPTQLPQAAEPVGLTQCVAAMAAPAVESQIPKIAIAHLSVLVGRVLMQPLYA